MSTEQLSEKEVIEKYLNDPEVMLNIAKWGSLFETIFKNWFTANNVIKKTRLKSVEEADSILNLLTLKGLAYSKSAGNVLKYKITMTNEARIKVLEAEVKEHVQAATTLSKQIAELQKNG